MAELSDEERKRIAREQQRILRMVQRTYAIAYGKILSLPEVRKAIAAKKPFSFENSPSATEEVNKILRNLSKEIHSITTTGIIEAWQEGENGLWRDISQRLAKTEAEQTVLNAIRSQAVSEGRSSTAKTFISEKRNKLNLSDRIWKNTQQVKNEIEIIVQNGILEGKSADDLAREAQKYLTEPDKLFRRIRNPETGKLELSKAAREYHPGTGKYRSSYKNALRLTSTEINRAYREAEWNGYQNNPLIIGYEIRLSNNHTCSDGKGGIIPGWTDICDDLAGKYPKWFKWTGWHPHCRCVMIPILISKADFAARVKARAEGRLDEWKPKNVIEDVPDSFKNWIANNSQRMENAKSLPYWIQDNFVGGILMKRI